MKARITVLVAIVALVVACVLAVLWWRPDAVYRFSDPSAWVAPTTEPGERAPNRLPGGAPPNIAFDAPAGWTLELDDRITALLGSDGPFYRIECHPDPPGFDSGHPVDLFARSPQVLPWVALPDGGFRVDADGPTGLAVLREGGERRTVMRWDVGRTPSCTLSAIPSRRVFGRVDGWEPGMEVRSCIGAIEVDDDGQIDVVVSGGTEREGELWCMISIYDGRALVAGASVPMDGEEPFELQFEPYPEREDAPDRLGWLDDRIAQLEDNTDSALRTFDGRIQTLESIIATDPTLEAVLRPRIERQREIRAAYIEQAMERYEEAREDALDDAER